MSANMKKSNATALAEGTNLHSLRVEAKDDHLISDDRQSRTLASRTDALNNFRELLKELRAPLNDLIKQRVGWTDRKGREHNIEYVEWHTVADVLDRVAPNWCYTIRELRQIGDIIACTAAITIDGITREGVGTGPAQSEMGIKKAESDALKRAARMFGVARDLYKDDAEDNQHQSNASSQSTQNHHNAHNSYYHQQSSNNNERVNSERTMANNSQREPQRDVPGFPADPLAHSTDDLVTPRQLVALRAIANSVGIEAETECQRLLKCDLKEISRRAASSLIDHLKSRANSARN